MVRNCEGAMEHIKEKQMAHSPWPFPSQAKPNQAIEVRGPPSQPLNIGNESYFPMQNCKNAE